jgi:UDPglucose 6-dehydrogenase
MNICVVGTGYVGLVTGAVFADLGNEVVCVDNDRAKISALEAGRMPIYEPGLEEMVARNVGDRRLSFTTDLGAGIRHGDVIFIAVGTPPKDSGETDLSQVEAVAAEIGRCMDRYKVVVNKSTVPVGTGELVREAIGRHQPRPVEFDVVSNPEFLREGSAIEDTLRPDRIVTAPPAGGDDVCQFMRRSGISSPTCRRRRSSSTPRTPSSPRRSPSSTPSRTSARRPART